LVSQVRRVVAELCILDEQPKYINPKAVDAAVKPEPQHVKHFKPNVRVPPVEIGLLRKKAVEVVLPGLIIERPSRASKLGNPVVRRPATWVPMVPDVPIALRVGPRCAAGDEPRMLIRGMIRNVVEDYFNAARMGIGDKQIEVCKRSEDGIDRATVRNVVTEVRHGRGEKWRDPDRADTEPCQIVQPLTNAGKIADTVIVGILKRARVDLVYDGALPPRPRDHARSTRHTLWWFP
jgi:hypothetical protein